MKLKLRAHHIEKWEFAGFLCPKQLIDQNGKIRKHDVMDVLSVDPFELGSLTDKMQLCEYLFASGSEE